MTAEHDAVMVPETRVLDAERRAENWRDVAVYFADILAASASMAFDRKTTSKSERRRQESIVRAAVYNLRAGRLWEGRRYRPEFVIERLDEVLAGLKSEGSR